MTISGIPQGFATYINGLISNEPFASSLNINSIVKYSKGMFKVILQNHMPNNQYIVLVTAFYSTISFTDYSIISTYTIINSGEFDLKFIRSNDKSNITPTGFSFCIFENKLNLS